MMMVMMLSWRCRCRHGTTAYNMAIIITNSSIRLIAAIHIFLTGHCRCLGRRCRQLNQPPAEKNGGSEVIGDDS